MMHYLFLSSTTKQIDDIMTGEAMVLSHIILFGVGSPAVRSIMFTTFKFSKEAVQIFFYETGSP